MNLRKIKEETQGITIVALMITVIIMLIIAGITIYSGKETIKMAKLEEVKTNMLLIEAKAKEYVEEATFKMGIGADDAKKAEVREQVYGAGSEEGAQLEKAEAGSIPSEFGITDTTTCYWITDNTLTKWGLNKIELKDDEKYLVQFNETALTVEIYNTIGYDEKYSLTDIEQI